MRSDRFIWVAGLVAFGVLLAGCSREAPSSPAAPPPTAVPTPTDSPEPTEPPDEYAIPDDPADIDEAYVERVLEALTTGYAEATREVATSTAITPGLRKILRETHTDEARQSLVADFRAVLRDHPDAAPLARKPTAPVVEVREVIDAQPDCIFTLVEQDFSGILRGGGVDPYPAYYYLVSRDGAPGSVNPTPWLIAGTGEPQADGEEFENPCA
jgi:hypothetical protein